MTTKVNTKGPRMQAFIDNATMSVPREWGDGSIMEIIKQIIEMIMPFIMGCFPMGSRFAKARFINTCQRMGRFRQDQIAGFCKQAAPKVDGLPREEEAGAADCAADCIISTLPSMSDDDLAALFDELYSA